MSIPRVNNKRITELKKLREYSSLILVFFSRTIDIRKLHSNFSILGKRPVTLREKRQKTPMNPF